MEHLDVEVQVFVIFAGALVAALVHGQLLEGMAQIVLGSFDASSLALLLARLEDALDTNRGEMGDVDDVLVDSREQRIRHAPTLGLEIAKANRLVATIGRQDDLCGAR